MTSPCYQNIYNSAIFRERLSAIPQKLLQLNPKVLPYTLYKHTPIQKVEKLCDIAWQRDDGRMSPFRNLSGVSKFKAIKQICMFDKVTVFAIQQNATNTWKWCLKIILMVLPLFEKTRNEHTLAKMSNVTFKQKAIHGAFLSPRFVKMLTVTTILSRSCYFNALHQIHTRVTMYCIRPFLYDSITVSLRLVNATLQTVMVIIWIEFVTAPIQYVPRLLYRKLSNQQRNLKQMKFLDILTTFFVNHESFYLTFWYAQIHIHTRKMATL